MKYVTIKTDKKFYIRSSLEIAGILVLQPLLGSVKNNHLLWLELEREFCFVNNP